MFESMLSAVHQKCFRIRRIHKSNHVLCSLGWLAELLLQPVDGVVQLFQAIALDGAYYLGESFRSLYWLQWMSHHDEQHCQAASSQGQPGSACCAYLRDLATESVNWRLHQLICTYRAIGYYCQELESHR